MTRDQAQLLGVRLLAHELSEEVETVRHAVASLDVETDQMRAVEDAMGALRRMDAHLNKLMNAN